jgi:PAS domain S-box-containing protein
MSAAIRILMVEDSPEDAELVGLHLRSHGLAFTSAQVDSKVGFLEALTSEPWDLVLSDFSLPGTNGMELLRILRGVDPDLPFILLSGVLDECAAVEAMRGGANDFLIKSNLARLVPAIQREMKDAELRRNQRLFEEELRLLHTAIGQTPDMVIITNPAGQILYANAAAEVITGFKREELLGQNPRLFKSGRHDGGFYKTMWETLLRGETWKGHIVNRRKDGACWDAESVIAPVYAPSGDIQNYLCTARDSTLERQLQGFLEQSQRLETIGTLTSGIAHDFNNILMPVIGHAEIGLERAPGDPKLKHDLDVILASAMRARDLVRQILTFSRKGDEQPVAIEIQGLLAESLKLLRASIPTSISLEVDLDARDLSTLVDPTKLHQVILNLCTNAGHAMRGTAGHLTVRLRGGHLPATACAMNIQLPEGEYLCLEIADTGRGIAPEHLDKIFLPFFTTKSPQEGTGLGLSVTHGIVSAAGGGIQVASQPGAGTTFKVFLPIVATNRPTDGLEEEVSPEGQGRILLVDDDPAVLEMLQISLTDLGFQVSAHARAETALQAFWKDPGTFQVLVTDEAMPDLSGAQLARAIWEAKPGFPVILLSGTPELGQASAPNGPSALTGQGGFRACLAKPMSPKVLARTILHVVPEMERRGCLPS